MRREDRKKERRRVEEKWRGGQVKGERGKKRWEEKLPGEERAL